MNLKKIHILATLFLPQFTPFLSLPGFKIWNHSYFSLKCFVSYIQVLNIVCYFLLLNVPHAFATSTAVQEFMFHACILSYLLLKISFWKLHSSPIHPFITATWIFHLLISLDHYQTQERALAPYYLLDQVHIPALCIDAPIYWPRLTCKWGHQAAQGKVPGFGIGRSYV